MCIAQGSLGTADGIYSSFILKVKAAEIIPSGMFPTRYDQYKIKRLLDQYHLGLTMRFPRAVSIREDLTFADCMPASSVFEGMRAERKRKMEDTEP